ncbi:MAG: hypothetical protein KF685_08125 [Acidobacteria bacterium]|nr:hypothetical protein [Acidobacteriota bacterium]
MKAFCLSLLIFTIIAGANMTVNAQDEKSFVVGIGKEVDFSGKRVTKVKFLEVTEDSRCPEGVDCFWAGNARLKIELSFSDDEPVTLEMDTNGPNSTVKFEGGTVSLIKLDPYPKNNVEFDRSAYKVSLKIEEADH